MFVDSRSGEAERRKAYDEILRQLDCVRRGEFTDEELTATRLLMQTSLEAVGDSLSATEEWSPHPDRGRRPVLGQGRERPARRGHP